MFYVTIAAQTGVGANFGVEGDAYSGDATSGANSDDWFYNGIGGAGVIDEATAITNGYAAQLAAGNNISFDLRQSIPNYAINSGYIWYSSRYVRDYIGVSPDNDLTTFQTGKNGDDPSSVWAIKTSSVSGKNDLVDAGVHMRRDGVNVTDDLWVHTMISSTDTNGSHSVDFELFVSEIAISGTGFTNSGTAEGHTPWTFNADGSVATIGDLIMSYDFANTGVTNVDVRIWVDKDLF